MREYIGVIRRDPDHGFAVTFPDLPAAEQGLSKHLAEMHAAGAAIPAASRGRLRQLDVAPRKVCDMRSLRHHK